MLIRYSTDSSGRPVQKAVIYTKSEHSIPVSQIDSDAVYVITRLRDAGFASYVVGGAVRDLIVGKKPKDLRKTTWLPRHRKKKPFPATAPQEKSQVRNWRSKGHLAPLMRPTKFPEIPVSLQRNTEVFRHPLL